MLPVECVARGYLAGSGYTDYLRDQSICGNGLPPGLKDGAKLPKTLFTPATKAAIGDHDENVTFDEVLKNVEERDYIDTHREDSPLLKAKDAIEFDNSNISKQEQFQKVLKFIPIESYFDSKEFEVKLSLKL